MSRVSPEMLQCVQTPENGTDLSVLERQRARMKWYQQQQQQHHQNAQQAEQSEFSDTHLNVLQFQSGLVNNDAILVKSDPDFHNGYTGLEKYPIPVAEEEYNGSVEIDSGKMASSLGRANTKKRKADKAQSQKIVGAEETNEKRMKKVTEQSNNREHSGDNSRENSKVSEAQKPDYIHVRARRGQATDSHSLAERVRREKISERMKYLQDLVPGCNKVIGKAGMLDEIINYVQSLQKQVEFLSMKLAAVNPRLDFNIEDFFNKEMFPSCANSFPTIGMLSEVANPSYLHFNHVQQVISCCGVDIGINPLEMALERTTSSAVSVPETFLDPSYFSHTQQASIWESDLQSIYNIAFNQGRSTSFPSQSFTGTLAANNLKMEM